MRKAEIADGKVVNIVVVDPSNIPDWCFSWPDADESAEIGGSFSDGKFTPNQQKVDPIAVDPSSLKMSFAQLLIGLVSEAFITEQEAELWLQGQLPQPVLAIIDTLPLASRFAAKVKATRPSEVLRADPIVWAMADSKGMTPEQLDQFFINYSAV